MKKSAINKVFKNPEYQEDFESKGYIIVDFYTPDELIELQGVFDKYHPEGVEGFYASTFSGSVNYRNEANAEIIRLGERPIRTFLDDIKIHCGSFIVKGSGESSLMPVHQDMTLVDETKFTGINIWAPLCDLNETNGPVFVLEGSHLLHFSYRGGSIPEIYHNIRQSVIPYMKPFYLKAGQAIIFNPSTLHYSPANISGKLRIVTNTYVTHKDAKFVTAYFEKNSPQNGIELFQQEDDFLIKFMDFGFDMTKRPEIGKSIGFVDYNFPEITEEDLQQIYGKKVKI